MSIEPRPDLLSAISALRMTQKEFAAKVGLTTQFINDLVRGRRAPSLETAGRILDAVDADERVRAYCVSQWHPELEGWMKLRSAPVKQDGGEG